MSVRWPRPLTVALDVINRRGKAVGVRLVKYTGKSPHFIHPKHLVNAPWHDWYLEHLHPADFVLDVGCANGAHAVKAARQAKRVIGVDYDPGQLRVAADSVRRLGLDNVRLFAWDLTRALPFTAAAFDAVLFLDVIEHLGPRLEVLQEIRRVLRPEGRLLVSAPNRETSWRRQLQAAGLFAYSDPDHKIEYTEEEFLAGLIDALGGLSLGLYAGLSRWKREVALRHPDESTGFRVVARRAP